MDRFTFIQGIHSITFEEYRAIESRLTAASYKKGESVLRSGDVQRHLIFVKTGVQALSYRADEKNHIIAFTYFPNLCSIPDSFPTQTPTRYEYSCLSDSEFDYLSYEDLQQLFKTFPNIETLFRKIGERLLTGLLTTQTELRTMSIEERFKIFCRRSPHLLRLIPHKYIASYLEIDSTNFSKLFNKVKI